MERFWVAFGKFSALVTTLATIIGIYIALKPVGPQITANSSYQDYVLPPDLIEGLRRIKDAQSYAKIKQLADNILEKEPRKALDVASSLSAALTSSWPEQFRYEHDFYRHFYNLTIANTGDKPAIEVVLDVPLRGVALLTREGLKQETIQVDGTLPIGNLRPGNSVRVALWSRGLFDITGKMRLTHSSGVGSVSYATTVYGFRGWVANNLESILFMVILFVFLVSLLWANLPRRSSSQPIRGT